MRSHHERWPHVAAAEAAGRQDAAHGVKSSGREASVVEWRWRSGGGRVAVAEAAMAEAVMAEAAMAGAAMAEAAMAEAAMAEAAMAEAGRWGR